MTRAQARKQVETPKIRTTFGFRHYSYLAPRIYNKISLKFKNVQTLNKEKFKNIVTCWLLTEMDRQELEDQVKPPNC